MLPGSRAPGRPPQRNERTNPRAMARAVGAIGTGRRGSTPPGGMAAQSCMACHRVSHSRR
eukprot:scaffold7327_cov141-Isochrysis_galbana.AAC.2